MRKHLSHLFLTAFLTAALPGSALDFSKINISYQYDLTDLMAFKSRVTQQANKLHVYFQVEADSIGSWEQSILLQSGYESVHDTLKAFSVDTLMSSPVSLMIKLTLDVPDKNLLILSWADLNLGIYRVYDIPIQSTLGFPAFLPVDEFGLPILENYVINQSIDVKGASGRYHVFRYIDDFEAADPAMGMMKAIAPTLRIDSSFFFSGNLSGLQLYKFYLIQEDTLSENGITILRTPAYYPEYRRLEELIGPLTYITTPNEKKMLTEQMSKKSFENFWLNTYNTKLRAKMAIKNFYDKVENANRLFTSYKQGWKTDRGMLYIIFGRPDQVVRSGRREVWKYLDGLQFEFIRISTLFTPSLYSLKRDRKYEEIWYDQVGSIRKGL